jgi:GNAT superfamily N-acetyltransferase
MLQHRRFFANFATLRETSFVLKIIQAETDDQIDDARRLFREYESWHGMDLCFQDYEQEVAELPWKYVKPEGRLFLAFSDDKLAGCIAMRKLEDRICEMKRLFVRDSFRGQRIGVQLIEKLIDDARAEGYAKMRLDTFPQKMGKAVSLYESHGFRHISPYYENPHDGVIYMELDL